MQEVLAQEVWALEVPVQGALGQGVGQEQSDQGPLELLEESQGQVVQVRPVEALRFRGLLALVQLVLK